MALAEIADVVEAPPVEHHRRVRGQCVEVTSRQDWGS